MIKDSDKDEGRSSWMIGSVAALWLFEFNSNSSLPTCVID